MMREAWNKESEKCFTLFIKHMTEITSGAVLPKDFKSEDLQAVLTVAEEMETVPLPSDHLGRLRAEKDLTDLVKCSSEVTNLAKVIKLTFSVLVDGNALDPINPDENLGALVSILFSPSDGVKGLPQFQVFSQLAEARLLSMLRKTLDSVASPLLSRLGARKLLAFVDSKGPELQVDMDLDIDQDTIKSSQKQCEQIVKSFPEWLEKKLPDFGVSMTAAAAEGSGDADQAEDESGLSLAQVRIWMVCFLPKALKTVALCKTCSALEAGLVKDPKVTSSKYQEFLTATASAYAELEEFGSSMTALTLNESDGDGAKIFVTNKFIGIVEAALCRSAQSVVKAAVDVKCKVLQELDEVLSNEELLKTNDLINAGCTEVTMPKLLLEPSGERDLARDEINQISIDHAGHLCAVAEDAGPVHLLDLNTWRVDKTLAGKAGHDNICSCVAWKPGRDWTLASGGLDAAVVFWQRSGRGRKVLMQQDLGEESATATGPQLLNPPFVHSLAYLPDETLAAGLGDGTVALLEERRPSARLRGHAAAAFKKLPAAGT
eukprot:g10539.t1